MAKEIEELFQICLFCSPNRTINVNVLPRITIKRNLIILHIVTDISLYFTIIVIWVTTTSENITYHIYHNVTKNQLKRFESLKI